MSSELIQLILSVPSKFLCNDSIISVWLGALFSVTSNVCKEIISAIARMMEGLTLTTEVTGTCGVGDSLYLNTTKNSKSLPSI